MGILTSMGMSAAELELLLEQAKRDLDRDVLLEVRSICDKVISESQEDRESNDGDDI